MTESYQNPKCPHCETEISGFACADAAVTGEMYRIDNPTLECPHCEERVIVRSYTFYVLEAK